MKQNKKDIYHLNNIKRHHAQKKTASTEIKWEEIK